MAVIFVLAGCAGPVGDQDIDVVSVMAYGSDGVELHVRGGPSDPDTRSGLARAPPFEGRLDATYYAGMKSQPQNAGQVHSASYRIEAADFRSDAAAARLYNEGYRDAGEPPLYGSEDISVIVLHESDSAFRCGGFYFVDYEVVVDGRSFTGRADFHMDAC